MGTGPTPISDEMKRISQEALAKQRASRDPDNTFAPTEAQIEEKMFPCDPFEEARKISRGE